MLNALADAECTNRAAYHAAPPDVSKRRGDELIAWIRAYSINEIDWASIDEHQSTPPSVVIDLGNRGVLGMLISENAGGLALRMGDFLRVIEQIAATDLSLAVIVQNSAMGAYTIQRHASPEKQLELLPAIARGREFTAVAITEP